MADELLDSLRAVDARKAAEVFGRSFAYFPGGKVPEGLNTRQKLLGRKGDDEFFDKLGEEFYARAEDCDAQLCGYILTHAAEFERLHGASYRD